jgi:hypothetical protein
MFPINAIVINKKAVKVGQLCSFLDIILQRFTKNLWVYAVTALLIIGSSRHLQLQDSSLRSRMTGFNVLCFHYCNASARAVILEAQPKDLARAHFDLTVGFPIGTKLAVFKTAQCAVLAS